MTEKNRDPWKLVIMIALALLLSASTTTASLRIVSAAADPTRCVGCSIIRVAPANDSLVTTTFYVTPAVTNFTIVQPGAEGQVPKDNEGHFHVFLDGNYYALWASSNSIPFTNIQPGTHKILVQLVNDAHAPFSPDISLSWTLRVTDAPAGTPKISILAPSNGASVNSTFTVSFIVGNFTLTNPVGQPNAVNTGHIHILIDGKYTNLWARPEGIPLTIDGSGSHTVQLQLVNNDHSPLNPDVSITRTYNVNNRLSSSVSDAASTATNASNYALAATVLSLLSLIVGIVVVSRVWKTKKPA